MERTEMINIPLPFSADITTDYIENIYTIQYVMYTIGMADPIHICIHYIGTLPKYPIYICREAKPHGNQMTCAGKINVGIFPGKEIRSRIETRKRAANNPRARGKIVGKAVG